MSISNFQLSELQLTVALVNAGSLYQHRKVVKIEMVDEYHIRYHNSLDFTVPSLSGTLPDRLYVPLAVVPKSLLTDVDASDEWGKRLPMLNRRLGKELTVKLILLWWSTKYAVASATPMSYADAEAQLDRDGYGAWLTSLVHLREDENPPQHDETLLRAYTTLAPPDAAILGTLVEFLRARGLLFGVLENPAASERRIIKLAYTTKWSSPLTGPSKWKTAVRTPLRVAASGWNLLIDAAGVDAESIHFEFRAPEGLVVEDAVLVNEKGQLVDSITEARHMAVAHLYAHHESGIASCSLRLGIAQRGWIRSAVLSSVLGAIFVTLSLALIGRLQTANSAIYAASTILALGAVAAIYVARPNEHPLTTVALSAPRTALLISSMCSLMTILILLLEVRLESLAWWAIVLHCATIGAAWLCVPYLWWFCWLGPARYAARHREERRKAGGAQQAAGGLR